MSAYYQQILDSQLSTTSRAYTPNFRLEAVDNRGWNVFDGDRHIARLYPIFFDIWVFSPFEDDIKFNQEPPGKVVDLHTLHNTFINLGMAGWPKTWCTGNLEQDISWEWESDTGAELVGTATLHGPEGEWGAWKMRWWYDPSWSSYRISWSITARKMDPDGMEAFNLMTAGALGARPEDRRWTHSLWENADQKLRRIVLSNALFHCTDYGGYRHGSGPWRRRHASYPQGWIGYTAHDEFNPICVIHHTNVPLTYATCSQLFDEHICWERAGQDNLQEDGYFHYELDVELINLPASLAKELLDQATDPVKPKKWHHFDHSLPFAMDGHVNSFEDEVDPWAPEECPIFSVSTDPDAPIAWATDEAHTGSRSLRFTGESPHGRKEIFPAGAVCRVKLHTRYRLTCWIKTVDVDRFARLELDGIEYTFANKVNSAASPNVSGTQDWTRVDVELDSADQAYLLPRLVLYGSGTAWFDDISLSEI